MDKDIAARLDRIEKGQQNLCAAVAIAVQRLTMIGERLTAIETLLTPEPQDPSQPTLRDLIEQGFAGEEQALRIITQHLIHARKSIRDLPLETVRTLDDGGKLVRAGP